MALYHFRTEMEIGATPEQVWRVLEDPTTWPAWWRWLRRVEVLGPGRGDAVGARCRFEFRTRLPYTLAFESETVRIAPPSLWESRVTGELAGTGLWEVAEREAACVVRWIWIVATTKRWMNVLAPVARPAFSWNHRMLMHDLATGLARRLGAPLVSVEHRVVRPGAPGFGQLSPSIQP
jgi:Polyketide cyclase / dehydrase and lipid transport